MKNILLKKEIILVFILASVIAVSGCVDGGGNGVSYGRGDALDVELMTDLTTMDSLEPFTITVRATNEGEFDATNVEARLQGYDGIAPQETDERLSDKKDLSPGTLAPPDPEHDVSGDVGDVDWDVYAPLVSAESPDLEITLTAEVFYDYKSLVTSTIVVVDRDHLEQLEQRGESIPVKTGTTSNSGPIYIDIEAPYPYVTISSDETEFRIKITLENDGSGSVYNTRMGEYDYLKEVTLRVPRGLAIGDDCDDFELTSGNAGSDGEKTLKINYDNNRNKLRLIEGGKNRDLHCTLVADMDYISGYNQFTISASTDYRYIQSATRRLIVTGTEEEPLRVNILEPTSGIPDKWKEGEVHSVEFEVLYQNSQVTDDEISAADFKDDITVWVGGVLISGSGHPSTLTYDDDDEVWVASVTTPDLGDDDGDYDLKVQAEYQDIADSDTETNAIEYST